VVVACFLEEYDDEEPQLAIIEKKPEQKSSSVEVEWMTGAYSKPWKLWKDKNGTWKEKILFSSILSTVNLDSNDKLVPATVNKLKRIYQHIRS